MPATLTDIAEAAGVSIATVSRALNDSDHPVAKATRQRILELAKELGYQPNWIAQSLRTDRTHTVGIIAENILSPFIPTITRGIQDRLKLKDYFSIIINSDWDPATEADAIRALNTRHIEGIIFVESWHRSSETVLELANRPHVFVHRLYDSLCPNSVIPDGRYGARLAVKHLAGLGHRQIGYIGGPEGWDVTINRLAGYQEELAAWGIPFEQRLVKQGDWEVQSGYLAAKELMDMKKPPTAIFAANDLMALGTIYAIQEAGLRVPDDIAVVGYDNRDFSGFVRPAITTVRLPSYQMGRTAAELLLKLCDGTVKAAEPIQVQGELIVRESCGAGEGTWVFEEEPSSIARRLATQRRSETIGG